MRQLLTLIVFLSCCSLTLADGWQPNEAQAQKWDNQQRQLVWEEAQWLADNSINKTILLGQQGYKFASIYCGAIDIRVSGSTISFTYKGKKHIYHGEYTVREE